MSVCDPVTGMHSLFSQVLTRQFFADAPACRFGEPCTDADIQPLARPASCASPGDRGVIMEPIVQGAGGMRFYSAEYLQRVRTLCDDS